MEFIEFLENEIETRLQGFGIRVVIFEGDDDFVAKYTMPGEFVITLTVAKEDEAVMKMTQAAEPIARFSEMYMDGALHYEIGKLFLELPGVFSFMTENTDIRAKRMIGMLMHEIYGRHNVYAINVNEENIRVDTRAGRFYFNYTDFNVSVKKEIELIDRCMRKPLRKLIWK